MGIKENKYLLKIFGKNKSFIKKKKIFKYLKFIVDLNYLKNFQIKIWLN
jgi:hypothetical protein